MSYTCLLMVLCDAHAQTSFRKHIFNVKDRIDLFICLHRMFQISFQNSKGLWVSRFWVFGQNFCSVYFFGLIGQAVIEEKIFENG